MRRPICVPRAPRKWMGPSHVLAALDEVAYRQLRRLVDFEQVVALEHALRLQLHEMVETGELGVVELDRLPRITRDALDRAWSRGVDGDDGVARSPMLELLAQRPGAAS